MTQPSNPAAPPLQEVKQWRAGAITVEVGVPSFVMQLFNGELVTRLLTLKMVDDFMVLSRGDKFRVIWKVALVGLITLGICAAVSFMNPLFIWAVPLCMITTMGLAFSLLTLPTPKKEPEQPQLSVDPQWGPGRVLGRGTRQPPAVPAR